MEENKRKKFDSFEDENKSLDKDDSFENLYSESFKDDGVIYTPSSEKNLDQTKVMRSSGVIRNDIKPIGKTQTPNGKRKLTAKAQKSQFGLFFVVTIFLGAIIIILTFALLFNSMLDKAPKTNNAISTEETQIATSEQENQQKKTVASLTDKTVNAMIVKTFDEDKNISLFDLDNEKIYKLLIDSDTIISDKFGSPIIFAELSVGDIIFASFGETSNLLSEIRISTLSWNYPESTNVVVNQDAKTITYRNTQYFYDQNLISIYNDESYELANIDPVDIVNLRGYKDKVYFLEVAKSHGSIAIAKREDIVNGFVEVDTNISTLINETVEIKVPEGPRRIVIKGDNIEPVIKEIIIERGQVFTLDLSEIELKSGVISFKINELDATLTINDEVKNANEPIVLEYGEYVFKVAKDGFASWEETVKLNSPTVLKTVNLEKKVEISILSINTVPEGADIYIDNAYIGISPVNATVEYGTRSMLVKKEGYVEVTFPLTIDSPKKPVTLGLQEDNTIKATPTPEVTIIPQTPEEVPIASESPTTSPNEAPQNNEDDNQGEIIPPTAISPLPPGTTP